MPLPGVRFTVRRLMVAVAVVAIAFGLWVYAVGFLRDPLSYNELSTSLHARAERHDCDVRQAIPVSVVYDFKFRDPAARHPIPFGKFCQMRGEVWIEDLAARPPKSVLSAYGSSGKRIRAGLAWGWVTHAYTFDDRIVAGLREEVAGRISWPISHDRPGRYAVCYTQSYRGPWGRWREISGGMPSMSYRVHAVAAPGPPEPD